MSKLEDAKQAMDERKLHVKIDLLTAEVEKQFKRANDNLELYDRKTRQYDELQTKYDAMVIVMKEQAQQIATMTQHHNQMHENYQRAIAKANDTLQERTNYYNAGLKALNAKIEELTTGDRIDIPYADWLELQELRKKRRPWYIKNPITHTLLLCIGYQAR